MNAKFTSFGENYKNPELVATMIRPGELKEGCLEYKSWTDRKYEGL